MPDLNNKTVLVTGGSRGIGAAIARAIGTGGGRINNVAAGRPSGARRPTRCPTAHRRGPW